MKKLTLGIVAHVDAGKTTLSEAILYESGTIRTIGRVDKGSSFLDTDEMEKNRGITIYAKQAEFSYENTAFSLLDTPGHVDFSAEMERTLQVLDVAVLVISAADGIQSHTLTLWKLLAQYKVPVFLFFNKMDQPGADAEALLTQVRERLSAACVDFNHTGTEAFYDETAMTDENAMEEFLENGTVSQDTIRKLVADRKIFPCFFGSALQNSGIRELLSGLDQYVPAPHYREQFGAKIYKITRDEAGNRLVHMKITGGSMKVKTVPQGADPADKINQIRIYSGIKYSTVNEVTAGCVCAVTGLDHSKAGDGLGMEGAAPMPLLEPVLTYRILLPEDVDAAVMLPKFREVEEEEPELHILWNEKLREIYAQLMGEVQTEILKDLIRKRYGIEIAFGPGHIVYRETIAEKTVGVGHFEPLRHYAEVQLLMEPGEPGSGLSFDADVSEDVLDKNWQRLILTHLKEREHPGVLTGSPISDMKITVVGGRSHNKHTEGGDFRQATYRAVRQGLMRAENVLLEPYYSYRLELPGRMVGHAMADMEEMHGNFRLLENNEGNAVLEGSVPAAEFMEYPKKLLAYTKGMGRLSYTLKGYEPCHNTEEVLERIAYEPEADTEHPADSVFCSHGAGVIVPWDEVEACMHTDRYVLPDEKKAIAYAESDSAAMPVGGYRAVQRDRTAEKELVIGTEEIDEILGRTMYANRKSGHADNTPGWKRRAGNDGSGQNQTPVTRTYRQPACEKKEEYLLVDGYNVIFAWDELKELAGTSIDGARGRLLDILCNYQGIRQCEVIAVFDAYRVKGHDTEILDYHNIHVVYTREAETADQYIEKFAHAHGREYRVTVVTSDGLEQIIIRGQGCALVSSREFEAEVERVNRSVREELENRKSGVLTRISDHMKEDVFSCEKETTPFDVENENK